MCIQRFFHIIMYIFANSFFITFLFNLHNYCFMKKLVLSLICILTVLGTSAQSFNKGDKVLNLGIGFGNSLYHGTGYKTTVPPLSASLEYGVVDNLFDEKSSIGIGGYFGYTGSKYNWAQNYSYKYSSAIIGVRGSLHYSFIEKLDTYTGVSLGYNIVSGKSDYKDLGAFEAQASAMHLGWYLGTRYYFSDNIAGMAELGYDIAYLTLGVAIKF